MENYIEEVPKGMPKHLDFSNQVFSELKNFDVEQQVEILISLYGMLEDIYLQEVEKHEKEREGCKQKLEILRRINPSKSYPQSVC